MPSVPMHTAYHHPTNPTNPTNPTKGENMQLPDPDLVATVPRIKIVWG